MSPIRTALVITGPRLLARSFALRVSSIRSWAFSRKPSRSPLPENFVPSAGLSPGRDALFLSSRWVLPNVPAAITNCRVRRYRSATAG